MENLKVLNDVIEEIHGLKEFNEKLEQTGENLFGIAVEFRIYDVLGGLDQVKITYYPDSQGFVDEDGEVISPSKVVEMAKRNLAEF